MSITAEIQYATLQKSSYWRTFVLEDCRSCQDILSKYSICISNIVIRLLVIICYLTVTCCSLIRLIIRRLICPDESNTTIQTSDDKKPCFNLLKSILWQFLPAHGKGVTVSSGVCIWQIMTKQLPRTRKGVRWNSSLLYRPWPCPFQSTSHLCQIDRQRATRKTELAVSKTLWTLTPTGTTQ